MSALKSVVRINENPELILLLNLFAFASAGESRLQAFHDMSRR